MLNTPTVRSMKFFEAYRQWTKHSILHSHKISAPICLLQANVFDRHLSPSLNYFIDASKITLWNTLVSKLIRFVFLFFFSSLSFNSQTLNYIFCISSLCSDKQSQKNYLVFSNWHIVHLHSKIGKTNIY